MGDTLNLATLARDSAKPSGDTSEPEMVETSHRDSDSEIESSTVRVCCTDQSARQYSDTIQLQETSTARVCCTDQSARLQPSAKGVCSCVQIASPSRTKSNDPEIPTESEIKDLLLKSIAQTKDQQNEINALRLALKNGLDQLETVLREFKGDIAEMQKQVSRREPKSIINPQQLVKPFMPRGKLSFGDTPVALRTRSKRRPCQQNVIQDSEESILQPTKLQESESHLRSADKQLEDVIQDSEASSLQTTKLRESEPNLRSADKQDVIEGTEASPVPTGKPSSCKAYKVKIPRQDTPSDYGAAESYLSSTTESDEDIPFEASRNLDSAESNSRLSRRKRSSHHPEKTTSRTERWRQGGVQPTKSQEDKFEPPKESVPVRTMADQRIKEALNQVPDAIHYNPKSKKTVVTLYAGNLDFKASRTDILESLRKHFKSRIQINELIIANHHGRSKGYGFITLSWVREAEVDPADICKLYSGMIQVKSRILYLQELREDVADKDHEKAYTTRNGVQQHCAGRHHLGEGLYCLADGTYLMKWY
jgi:hypothetical protein